MCDSAIALFLTLANLDHAYETKCPSITIKTKNNKKPMWWVNMQWT